MATFRGNFDDFQEYEKKRLAKNRAEQEYIKTKKNIKDVKTE